MAGDSASKESPAYASLGASSSKEGIHKAAGESTGKNHFATLSPDVAGDSDYLSILHADGAGTKSIVAYLAFKQSKEVHWFEGLAQDALVMNLDDVSCVGPAQSLRLSNTLGRNRTLIPDMAIEAILRSYRAQQEILSDLGIELTLCGGETADVGDLVRTLIVDATLFARIRKDDVVDFRNLAVGDAIVGLSSTGMASYEDRVNSGIGSNGLTLARHALIAQSYATQHPEILDPGIDPSITYQGAWDLFDTPEPLESNLASALLSPTRTYAPVLFRIYESLRTAVHGAIHCTGGGQTKCLNFGSGFRIVKDNLFPVPPIFKLIQSQRNVPWAEMYSVFNMGHRMELFVPRSEVEAVIQLAAEFDIEAQEIGRLEEHQGSNCLCIESEFGAFNYTA